MLRLVRSVSARLSQVPRSTRRAAGMGAVLGGAFLAWRSFLARAGGISYATVIPESGIPVTSYRSFEWEAWWRWPGMVLGLLVLLGGIALLIHVSRELRAARARPRGRRTRVPR